MKHLFLTGLILACMVFAIMPVSGQDWLLYFSGPKTCINPGDIATYDVVTDEFVLDPHGGTWEMEMTWDKDAMTFVDFPLPYCFVSELSEGKYYCAEDGLGFIGTVKLQAKPDSLLTNTIVDTTIVFRGNDGAFDSKSASVETKFCSTDGPEFPTAMIPAIAIIGFVFSVLLVQRTKNK